MVAQATPAATRPRARPLPRPINASFPSTFLLEAQLNSLMIRMAREVTVVADSSKFSKRSLSVIAGIDDVRRVITDHKADPQMVSTLRERGIDVMLV